MTDKEATDYLKSGVYYTTLIRLFSKISGLSFERIVEANDLAEQAYEPTGLIETGIYRCISPIPAFNLEMHKFYAVIVKSTSIFPWRDQVEVEVNRQRLPFQSSEAFFKVFKPYYFTNKTERSGVNKAKMFKAARDMTVAELELTVFDDGVN